MIDKIPPNETAGSYFTRDTPSFFSGLHPGEGPLILPVGCLRFPWYTSWRDLDPFVARFGILSVVPIGIVPVVKRILSTVLRVALLRLALPNIEC